MIYSPHQFLLFPAHKPPQTLKLPSSPFSTPPFFPATWLGVRALLGGTSNAGFLLKKCRGRSKSDMGSAGMTGKSSGAGKCVMPKVCQRTTSVLSMESEAVAAIQAGRPCEGVPLVCGTWRPAGWISVSESGGFVS